MMSFLQTGKALYVLAAICLAGIFTRLAAGSFYKRLIKESTNMALTKNKCLRNLKQDVRAGIGQPFRPADASLLFGRRRGGFHVLLV